MACLPARTVDQQQLLPYQCSTTDTRYKVHRLHLKEYRIPNSYSYKEIIIIIILSSHLIFTPTHPKAGKRIIPPPWLNRPFSPMSNVECRMSNIEYRISNVTMPNSMVGWWLLYCSRYACSLHINNNFPPSRSGSGEASVTVTHSVGSRSATSLYYYMHWKTS